MILILIGIKLIQQILFNLYLWQLKEYRIDRLKEHISRVYSNKIFAFLSLTLLSPIKFPQKSAKAMLIFILNLSLNSVFFLFNNPFIALLAILFTPFVLSVSLCLIYPFEKIVRIVIYAFASRKICSFQRKNGLTVIGITGSYGKTTTKFFLEQILSIKFKVLSTPKSYNNPLSISLLALKSLKKDTQIFIVEMGAYKIGEIKELCSIVKPQIGLITGISNQHLALFGSQENIIKAKSELLEGLPKKGLAIINKQSAYSPIIPQEKMLKIVFYNDRTYTVNENVATKKPRRFNLEEIATVNTNIPDFLKINLPPALILVKLYNIDEKEIKKKLSNLKLPQKTMQKIKGCDDATIIDDSYNANLEGTLAALDYLKEIKTKKKIVVMPCLIELGQDSEKIHQEIGRKLIQTSDLAIITSDDYIAAIKKGAGESQKIICLPHPKKVIDFLCTIVNDKSIILIEGKVHSSIIKFLIQP